MSKIHPNGRIVLAGFLTLVLAQACRPGTVSSPTIPVQPIVATTEEQFVPVVAPTKQTAGTPTQTVETTTPSIQVTVTAINGNLFIRRGPDLAYNPIGVLVEGTTVDAVARDVLSKWVQIVIPNSEDLGWVSLQTRYSEVQGELQSLPEFTPTDWPVPAYLRNCTHHQMVVQPGDIVLPSLLEFPENELWVYPGSYTVYDLDHPDTPEVDRVDISEGVSIDIRVDGNGEKRKCP